MYDQILVTILVIFVGIAVFLGILLASRGLIQWLIGTSDIIRLLEEQNRLLEIIATQEARRNVSRPNIVRNPPQP
jgi:K+-transporting ATPase A subunit